MLHIEWLRTTFYCNKLMYNNYIIYIFFLLLFGTIFSFAEECPPSIFDASWSETQYGYFEPLPMEVWGTVEFKTRDFGGRVEIKVNWATLNNYAEFGIYGITNDELKQIMYKAIIVQIAGRHCENLHGQRQYVFFEETECRVNRYCYLHLKTNEEIFCYDDGWPGPNPTYYTYHSENYYKIGKSIVCGIQCCEFIYTVECAIIPGGTNYPKIIGFSKNPLPSSLCTESGFIDCLTGEPEPCQSTCN